MRRAIDSASASDVKYGCKQVISVTPRLYDYLLTNVREPKILQKLREETATMRGSQMQVSPDQAQLLAMLVQILGAEKCIEVGVYTGYSSLAVALVLPEFGRLVACEKDEKSLEVAKGLCEDARLRDSGHVWEGQNSKNDSLGHIGQLFTLSQMHTLFEWSSRIVIFDGKIDSCTLRHSYRCLCSLLKNRWRCQILVKVQVDVKHGLAADALKSMIQNGEACSYDFAFLDAEKRMYQEYFELLLQLVRVGGIIVIDNVLWHGKVADPLVNELKTASIRNFNQSLMEDKRVGTSMVPIGDGMTICRKK